MNKDIYAIRHKESGKLLAKGGDLSLWGKVQFKDTINPKLFFSIEAARQAVEILGLCFAGLSEKDLEIVNTHNNLDREQWEAVK